MKRKGIILPIVVIGFVFLALAVPLLVKLMMQDSKASMADQKKSIAFNLAEAAVERGYWKAKSSTSTFQAIMDGNTLTGYNFDSTFNDISGGSYRIKLTSGPSVNQITILGEGKDLKSGEIRAIKAVFENKTIYSPLITNGNFTSSQFLAAFWGSIMAQGNFDLTTAEAAKRYFPRKYAKGVVTGQGSYTRDTNGAAPPNTDNVEWWSLYEYVPELPMLDFAVLRASAAATNTLNRYDLKSVYNGSPCKTTTGPLGGSYSICKRFPVQPSTYTAQDLVWYWDGDVIIEGYQGCSGNCTYSSNCTNHGFKGKLIVRGNLTINSAGCYKFTGSVPAYAYLDHYKLLKNTYDTSASNEYPGDIGYQVNKTTFNFGTETFQPYPGEGTGWIHTVGVRGFTYVGGNLTITGPSGFTDFVGAVWSVGNVTSSGGSGTQFCGVFFDDNLSVPTLNVVLVRKNWQEQKPSSQAWI